MELIGKKKFLLIPLIALAVPFLDSAYSVLKIQYTVLIFGLFSTFFLHFFTLSKIRPVVLFYVCCIIISSIVSSLGSSVPSAILYSLPLLVIHLANFDNVEKYYTVTTKSDVFVVAGIYILVLLPLLLYSSANFSSYNRGFYPWIGNPNYTALISLSCFIAADTLMLSKKGCVFQIAKFFNIIAIVLALFITESRGAILSVIFYIIMKIIKAGFAKRYSRKIGYFILLLSVFVQPILFYIFKQMSISDGRSLVFDQSNLERFSAYFNALIIVVSEAKFIYTGVGNVESFWLIYGDILDNIPHNWFMMFLISNGLIFTLVCFTSYIVLINKLPVRYIPGLCSLFILSTNLGRAVFFVGLLTFLMAVHVNTRMVDT